MEADSLRHCIVIYFYIYICVYTIYDYCNWAQGGKNDSSSICRWSRCCTMNPSCDESSINQLRVTRVLPAEESLLLFGGEIALNAVYSSTDISTYGNWVVHYRYVSRLVFYFWTEQFVYRFSFFEFRFGFVRSIFPAYTAYKTHTYSKTLEFTKNTKGTENILRILRNVRLVRAGRNNNTDTVCSTWRE